MEEIENLEDSTIQDVSNLVFLEMIEIIDELTNDEDIDEEGDHNYE